MNGREKSGARVACTEATAGRLAAAGGGTHRHVEASRTSVMKGIGARATEAACGDGHCRLISLESVAARRVLFATRCTASRSRNESYPTNTFLRDSSTPVHPRYTLEPAVTRWAHRDTLFTPKMTTVHRSSVRSRPALYSAYERAPRSRRSRPRGSSAATST